jgi:hypothetical protein
MAYERRRLSTESDKSSTSTTYSTESTTNYPTISTEQNLQFIKRTVSTNIIKSNSIKRSSTMSSPAEQVLARAKNTYVELNSYFQCSSLPK